MTKHAKRVSPTHFIAFHVHSQRVQLVESTTRLQQARDCEIEKMRTQLTEHLQVIVAYLLF